MPATATAATVRAHLEQHQAAAQAMAPLLAEVAAVADRVIACYTGGGVVYTCGNGGSAADAQHFSGELIGRYRRDRRPLAAVTLTADPSVWTCIANDYSAEAVFARQVEALAKPGDVVCGFTTSGRSPNVVAALRAAQAKGAVTVLFAGAQAGLAGAYADHVLSAPAPTTPRVQELHTLMLHMISDVVDAWAAAEKEV
ncbi:MAG: SIS domain-containing protein [Propionibacteriaceae bacterium]|jgi:D-sedoheptulose 7-phosphate isomerase|nr:SIS domain-containing protein [Propionibacteriaceae bacterium]